MACRKRGRLGLDPVLLIMLSVALLSHRHVRPAIIFNLCFLPPWRLIVTTGRRSLVPLDKLNLLSKFGSYSMASLRWYLFFMLFATVWYNLFVSLCSVGCLLSSHSLSLDKEESEPLLELSLIDFSLDALNLIFLISLSSQREPYWLDVLKIILFFFLIASSSFLHFFSYLW